MSTARVDFTRGAAERIAAVVRQVEGGNRDGAPLTFGKVQPEAGKRVRYVQWSGEWPANSTSTIEFVDSSITAVAKNTFAGVNVGQGWAALHRGTWHLVSANLALQPDYVALEQQVLGKDSGGIIQWFSITTCASATSSP